MDDLQVLDKDGVSAALRAAELMAFLDSNGYTLSQKLKEIYLKYGYHYNINSYFIINDNQITTKIFKRLRNFEGSPNTVSILQACPRFWQINRKWQIVPIKLHLAPPDFQTFLRPCT